MPCTLYKSMTPCRGWGWHSMWKSLVLLQSTFLRTPSSSFVFVILLAERLAATTRLFLFWRHLFRCPQCRCGGTTEFEGRNVHYNASKPLGKEVLPTSVLSTKLQMCSAQLMCFKTIVQTQRKVEVLSYILAQKWRWQYDSNFVQLHCSIFPFDSEPVDWKLAWVSDGFKQRGLHSCSTLAPTTNPPTKRPFELCWLGIGP